MRRLTQKMREEFERMENQKRRQKRTSEQRYEQIHTLSFSRAFNEIGCALEIAPAR